MSTHHTRDMLADLMKAALERGHDVPRLIANVIRTREPSKRRRVASPVPPKSKGKKR